MLAVLAAACADPLDVAEDLRLEGSPELVEALEAGSSAVRIRSAVAMGRIQSATYAAPLIRVANDPDVELRRAVLFALGQLALAEGSRLSRSTYATLDKALGDPDPTIVALAVEAIGKHGEPPLAHRIYPLLEHPSEMVRAEAALALFRSRFVPVRRGDAETPPELPDVAVAALIRAFDDESPEVRRAAVYAVSRYGQPRAVGALVRMLGDSDAWVRTFAARALGRSEDPRAVPALLPAVGDDDAHVRYEAVTAVESLGAAPDLPPSLAGDPSFHVRAALARALGSSGSDASLETLRTLEDDESTTVRAAALLALAGRLGAEYVDSLAREFDSAEWPIRVASVRAAAAIGAEAHALIDAALADEDLRVRESALEALGRIGEGAGDTVRQALGEADLGIRGTALTVYMNSDAGDDMDLLRSIYDGSPGTESAELRELAVEAAAPLKNGRGLVWTAARTDPDRAVRDRAQLEIRQLGRRPPSVDVEPHDPSTLLGKSFPEDPVAVLETTKGSIEIRLLASDAPVHVASFVDLVDDGFYDGLAWHRVVSDFVIQGGDPRGDGWGGPGYSLRDEINTVRFDRGAVGMPNSGRDTGGCQIFVTHVPTPHLDGYYTVFGRVISGMDVVDRIEVGDAILTARIR
jgi:cyclophilin family peptidyl-prolyl cis-trans isomerase/HEAT repeat protein